MAGITALAIAAASVAAVTPAAAQWHGHHRGGGAIAGFAAGAILGGVLASQQPYGYYGPGPGYYGPGPGYGGGDAVGYCMSRFKSYDPGSGTYLGYDGYRHSCP
jgi:ABC-type amino acid transport substrate-binding protein